MRASASSARRSISRRTSACQDQKFPDLRLVLSPSRRHKFRFEFIPIKYERRATLRRGHHLQRHRYDLGLPVNSVLDWKAYLHGVRVRFHLEQSRLRRVRRRGQVHRRERSTWPARSRPSSRAPGRPFPPLAASAASTSSRTFPSRASSRRSSCRRISSRTRSAHYVDFDLYGTVNFTNNIGAQIGYRSLDVGYIVEHRYRDVQVEGDVLRDWSRGTERCATTEDTKDRKSRSSVSLC